MTNELEPKYKGSKFTVEHCDGAIDSFNIALQHVSPSNKKNSVKRGMKMLRHRLADGKKMSKENFPAEGNLPSINGKPQGKFHAFKKMPIRAYCWLSKKHKNTYFISHYVFKDYKKLKQNDINKLHNNWCKKEK